MRRLQVDRRDLTRRARLRRQLSIDLRRERSCGCPRGRGSSQRSESDPAGGEVPGSERGVMSDIRLTSLTQPLAPPRSASGCSRLGRTPAGRSQSVIPRPTTIEVPVSTVEAAPRRLSAA